MFKKNNEISNVANSLVLASAILIFHVILLAGLGILVFIFSGIVNYFLWIFIGGSVLISGAVYIFLRYIKKQGGAAFSRVLSLPELKGKNVEINFLGGLATLKIADDNDAGSLPMIEEQSIAASRQLEDPETRRLKELMELARMLEKNLITLEEYNHVKKSLLN